MNSPFNALAFNVLTNERHIQSLARQRNGGGFREYATEISEGMVVLDAIHQIQATQATDLACRWNCKAGKCGSCSAEVNGMPRLMCMTRMSDLPLERPSRSNR